MATAAFITNNNRKKRIPFFGALRYALLMPAVYAIYYMTLYTKYTPDTYVFVQYAYRDNITRTIDIDSIVNNNVIFDILTIIGDLIYIAHPVDWLYLIIGVSIAAFLVKYIYLLKKCDVYPVVIVYFASFFIDLNQLRFNIASIMLYLAVSRSSRFSFLVSAGVGFLSHVMPPIIYVLTFARNDIKTSFLRFSPILLIIIASGTYNYVLDSRLFSYFSLSIGDYPKVLLLVLPLGVYHYFRDRDVWMTEQISQYAFTSFLFGVFLFPFNYELTARFFEIAFVAICVANAFSSRKPPIDLMLLTTALTIFASRVLSGISTQTDFSEQYMQSW